MKSKKKEDLIQPIKEINELFKPKSIKIDVKQCRVLEKSCKNSYYGESILD